MIILSKLRATTLKATNMRFLLLQTIITFVILCIQSVQALIKCNASNNSFDIIFK